MRRSLSLRVKSREGPATAPGTLGAGAGAGLRGKMDLPGGRAFIVSRAAALTSRLPARLPGRA